MKIEDLKINGIYDIKYQTYTNNGDKARWLKNLRLLEIGEEYTITNCRGSFQDKQFTFIQESKRPVKFYISKSYIFYIRKHFN